MVTRTLFSYAISYNIFEKCIFSYKKQVNFNVFPKNSTNINEIFIGNPQFMLEQSIQKSNDINSINIFQ